MLGTKLPLPLRSRQGEPVGPRRRVGLRYPEPCCREQRAGIWWQNNPLNIEENPLASEERKAENLPEIDLKEVEKLLEALEQDLKKVQVGTRDVQVLRDEVETLKNVLNSPVRRHHWVRDGLHAIRENFENVVDSALSEGLRASRYIAEIGRMLGM